jgi:C1A family cysteine protease
MRAVILCIVALIAGQAAANLTLAQQQAEFLNFVQKFEKKYDTTEAFFHRFNAFVVELNEVNAHNAKGLSWTAGINEWSDLTREEFFAVHAACAATDAESFEVDADLVDQPASNGNANDINWVTKGAVNKIKNQGQCGSCWAFGAIGTLEGMVFAVQGKALPILSEQQLVDCSGSTGNQGCNGGMPDRALNYLKSAGSCSQADYPYTGRDGSCKASSCKGDKVKTSGPKNGKGESTLENLLNTQPVSVAIDASSAFSRYTSGIFTGPCSSTSINHAVTAVGYDAQSWLVRNSWGTSWGNGGYINMKRGQNICNINNYLTVATP